jgi:hypothetical protein
MVCIIMNLPPHSIELPKNVFSFTLSLVKESESIIAATIITTPEDLKKIDSDKRKLSLPELDADYHPVLEWYVTWTKVYERALISVQRGNITTQANVSIDILRKQCQINAGAP